MPMLSGLSFAFVSSRRIKLLRNLRVPGANREGLTFYQLHQAARTSKSSFMEVLNEICMNPVFHFGGRYPQLPTPCHATNPTY
ncbi:hypothetical protein VP01_2607g3 [Puccinia sorghi]|uniref:Uncharacterized protein n=1 Tax=Puccinia sorghi TaxID=27349 RepID=A0A0L6V6D6_9BASI|nr:hypothetical protein VP01_2607g3 [Puccinia sorghi]